MFLLNLSTCQYILGKQLNNILVVGAKMSMYLPGESTSASLQNLSSVRSNGH